MKKTNSWVFDCPRTTRSATIMEPARRPSVYQKKVNISRYTLTVLMIFGTYNDEVLHEVQYIEGN